MITSFGDDVPGCSLPVEVLNEHLPSAREGDIVWVRQAASAACL